MNDDGTDLDRMIADVARSFTAREPQASMRRRVREELRAAAHSRPWVRPLYAGLAVTAGSLIIAAGMWLGREPVQPIPTQTIEMAGAPASLSALRESSATGAVSPPEPGLLVLEDRRVAASPPSTNAPAVQVDPLDLMPLGIEPVDVPLLVVDALAVDPLSPLQ